MKENEEKKEEMPVEGAEGKGMNFDDGNGGSHTAVEGGEKDEDDDKDKPVIGGGSSGFPVEK